MIVINNSQEFESVIGNLENSNRRIEELFNNQTALVNTVRGNALWQGANQESFHKKYDELSENYKDIEATLATYTKFLHTTLENYTNLENKINADADNNDVQLDVQS